MKIAIVGAGISGLTAAYLLSREHEVTVFEAAGYPGGHTHTVEVHEEGGSLPVDTGFIVFNDWTYPNFIKLLKQLGVATQESNMSFSVSCPATGLEYNGTSINTLFAQRSNLFRPSFLRMVADILRFNREAIRFVDSRSDMTLGEFLSSAAFSRTFIDHYLVPMTAAIWSSGRAQVLQFPMHFLAGFLNNHGMLSVNRRPTWRVIRGGSKKYVEKLIRPFSERIRLNTPVQKVRRAEQRVLVTPRGAGHELAFDQVVLAVHSDQALRMLDDPSDSEKEILGAVPYLTNETVLHTDISQLPRNRRAWASWNYRLNDSAQHLVQVTYHSNRLQSLDARRDYCVTLNQCSEIQPEHILDRMTYHHPAFSCAAVKAQERFEEVSGRRGIHYCGAYWGYGFHEDGVRSALRVCQAFGLML